MNKKNLVLMQFYKKYPRFTKFSGIFIAVSGIGWVTIQIRKTYEILNNALDTSVVHFMEPSNDKIYYQEDYGKDRWKKTYEPPDTVVNKAWNSVKFSYARRLLHLANNDNRTVRLKAVRHLAKLSNLDNWHYSLLAHMLDPRTAIGLARTEGVDLRFFVEPPYKYVLYNHEMVVNIMKDFLIALHSHSQHLCMGYFISRIFVDAQDVGRLVDQDSSSIELSKFIQSADDVLPKCLESILHHSTVENFAQDIVRLNGLPLLMEMYNRFKDNIDIVIILCRIISNVAVYPEHIDELFRSGWISVLAEWLKSADIRISAPAARALANLDSDENYDKGYLRRIYVLHPILRTKKNFTADVVFVHGLLGGVFYTWRQRDKNQTTLSVIGKNRKNETITVPEFQTKTLSKSSDPIVRQYIQDVQEQKQMEWENIGRDFEIVFNDIPITTNDAADGPYSCSGKQHKVLKSLEDNLSYSQCWPRDWLPEDCNYIRVIGVNYDTNLSMWAPICPSEQTKTNLDERSNEIMGKLVKAGLGRKPIIWVTHSMGGLIVKNILCKAWESNNVNVKNLTLNTKGVVFYSTPHLGSPLANINQPSALVLWPSVEVQELREDSPHLLEIHNKFLHLTEHLPIKILSFVETKSTVVSALKFNFLLITPRSANPGVGEYFEIPLDHLGICKPANRHSFLYQKVLHLIRETTKNKKFINNKIE